MHSKKSKILLTSSSLSMLLMCLTFSASAQTSSMVTITQTPRNLKGSSLRQEFNTDITADEFSLGTTLDQMPPPHEYNNLGLEVEGLNANDRANAKVDLAPQSNEYFFDKQAFRETVYDYCDTNNEPPCFATGYLGISFVNLKNPWTPDGNFMNFTSHEHFAFELHYDGALSFVPITIFFKDKSIPPYM